MASIPESNQRESKQREYKQRVYKHNEQKILDSLKSYKTKFIASLESKLEESMFESILRYGAENLELSAINDSVRKYLLSRTDELKGITLIETGRGTTQAFFDQSNYGISIANPTGVFEFAETILLRRATSTEVSGICYLPSISYNDIRRFSSGDELVEELVRLQQYFFGKSVEEITDLENKYKLDRSKSRIFPKRKNLSRINHNGGNRRRERKFFHNRAKLSLLITSSSP